MTFKASTLDVEGKRQFELIASECLTNGGHARPVVIWCRSPIEALQRASEVSLLSEMQKVLETLPDLDVDLDDLDLSIEALGSNFARKVDAKRIQYGIYSLFTLGETFGRKKDLNNLFTCLTEGLDRHGYTVNVGPSIENSLPEPFSSNCRTLNRFVDVKVSGAFRERVGALCGLNGDLMDVNLLEAVDEGLSETWRHIRRVGPVKLCDPRLNKIVGPSWVFCYEDTIWASQGPTLTRLDAEGYLHADDGPAAEFSDGAQLWAWHGHLVPSKWIAGKPSETEVDEVRRYIVEYAEIKPAQAVTVLSDIMSSKW